MLLRGYRADIFEPACNPHFQSVHCIAYLDGNVGEALPYLNAVLGGDTYIRNPPSVTFRMHGKLITVHSDRIAVNALRDRSEAYHVLDWIKQEINDAWENRATITPKFEGIGKPGILEIYKLLPKTNCRSCGQPTCMMFASLAAEGAKDADDCPQLDEAGKSSLQSYLSRFGERG